MDPLITPEELGKYLHIEVAADAAAIAVAGASGLVRSHCGWPIAPKETATFIVDGGGNQILNLPTLRLVDVTAVRVNGETLDFGVYRWQRRGQLFRLTGWPNGMSNVEVDAEHGYAETPDAVRAVTLAIAGGMFENPTGRSVSAVGLTRAEYEMKLTGLQLAQLAEFKI